MHFNCDKNETFDSQNRVFFCSEGTTIGCDDWRLSSEIMDFEKKTGGLRVFGLSKQTVIKHFFGANASLAIFILLLICFFLLKEAWFFLPNHHEQLRTFRRSGVEYYTLVDEAYQNYKTNTGGINRAYAAELAWPNRENQLKMTAYEVTRKEAERQLGHDLLVLKDAIKQRKDEWKADSERAKKLDKVIEDYKGRIDAKRDWLRGRLTPGLIKELKPLSKEARAELVDAVVSHDLWERADAEYYELVEEQFDEVWEQTNPSAKPIFDVYRGYSKSKIAKPLDKVWKEAFEHATDVRDRYQSNLIVPEQVVAQVNIALGEEASPRTKALKYAQVLKIVNEAEFFDEYARVFYLQAFSDIVRRLDESGSLYATMTSSIRKPVEARLSDLDDDQKAFLDYLQSDDRPVDGFVKALPDGQIDSPLRILLAELASLDLSQDETVLRLAEASEEFLPDFPFGDEAETLYALTDRYNEAVQSIKTEGNELLASLPDPSSLQTSAARKELKVFRKNFAKDVAKLESVGERLDEWRHDQSWGWGKTLSAVFLGKKWTNNSQVVDRYGLLPIITGSLIISLIALIIAVPLSVAAAIYANQIAGFKEQSFLKPAIEFIGAIPSVVLGFLGIMVVGDLLKELSYLPLFSWLPGFPIEARLNMLVAGILLAFMACPIIFTLAEDALNNVPSAYRDGAFSLGANRLQTAIKVILPASFSGVVAAVLLGFGRVVGETMVVLLVAGNRLAIPDFTKGPGVVTDPSHTMTGIIAQNLGEASKGSVDWQALFFVGLFLFGITLVVNYIGQRILGKFQSS